MDCDELIVGSGLTALATAMGLPSSRRTLVLGGHNVGAFQYYGGGGTVPCAHTGIGGLGQYWHGVIPTPLCAGSDRAAFERLFTRFYPATHNDTHLQGSRLFIPWRPIRPERQWPRLAAERSGPLRVLREAATRFELHSSSSSEGAVSVYTHSGRYTARRLWLAAGALHTPALLQSSLTPAQRSGICRDRVSDHVIIYLGQINRRTENTVAAPRVWHGREGMWIEATLDQNRRSLGLLRPARFGFRRLDAGIEQRAAFSLPAASALRKLVAGASPALLAEALYTRLGLWPGSYMQSVYAQVVANDAYRLDAASGALQADGAAIRAATDAARAAPPWRGLVPSKRPEVYLPGIHLHHSVRREMLLDQGLDCAGSALQIVDASTAADLGPAHHSFRLMCEAHTRAAESA